MISRPTATSKTTGDFHIFLIPFLKLNMLQIYIIFYNNKPITEIGISYNSNQILKDSNIGGTAFAFGNCIFFPVATKESIKDL